MPSITYWNRLEPRARSTDLANALAARVRDPAWLLARQWQLGEFEGADGGSPAYVRIAAQVAPLAAWSAGTSAAPSPLAAGVPLECATTAEGASPGDLALAVRLGQTFDRFLAERKATPLRAAFLAAFPIGAAPPAGEAPTASRLRALWRGRAIDGVALYLASQRQPPAAIPAAVPAESRQVAGDAVVALVAWVQAVVGEISAADPAAWRPAQLDYDVRVLAAAPSGQGAIAFAATPDRDGDLLWHAFDAAGAATATELPPPATIERAVIPGPVRFRGMPNERFWDFEDGRVDFGAMTPDRRGLASLILMDFMLVHGNDWFLVPFELPVGSVCTSALTVVDVFGQATPIPRADAAATARRWTMFSAANAAGAPSGYFVTPATAAGTVADGAALEDVRFLRDDIAGVTWGVERAVEGSLGTPWLAADRDPPAPPPTPPPADGALAYRIQSAVPPHWIPFVPTKAGDEVALERAALLSLSGAAPSLPVPLGRILEPTQLAGAPYRLREEQVPREGVRVIRRARRARGVDGGTSVWVARARSVGTGEGWSGLRFDLAIDE